MKEAWLAHYDTILWNEKLEDVSNYIRFSRLDGNISSVTLQLSPKAISSITIGNSPSKISICQVFDRAFTAKEIASFNARSLSELLVKMELEGFLFDEPCI